MNCFKLMLYKKARIMLGFYDFTNQQHWAWRWA
jgi:hypothetical protein